MSHFSGIRMEGLIVPPTSVEGGPSATFDRLDSKWRFLANPLQIGQYFH